MINLCNARVIINPVWCIKLILEIVPNYMRNKAELTILDMVVFAHWTKNVATFVINLITW